MIRYELNMTPNDIELKIAGHDEEHSKEFHAVCGMVSAVSQSCVYGIVHFCDDYELTEYEPGRIKVKVKNLPTARALCLSCLAGLNAIKQQFPRDFEG